MGAALRQRWEAKASGGSSTELRLNTDDMAFFWFIASGGDEGDDYLAVYQAHEIPAISNNGKPFSKNVVCSVLNDYGEECRLCQEGGAKLKDRMSMWIWITDILHKTMRQGQQMDVIQYQGQSYFREPINGPRLWHTSAWRESPWDTIVTLNANYGGLQKFVGQLTATGEGMQRRYKLFALPNTEGIPAENLEQARQLCKPIRQILMEGVTNQPTVQAPAQVAPVASHPTAHPAGAWSPGGAAAAAPWSPPSSGGEAAKYTPVPATLLERAIPEEEDKATAEPTPDLPLKRLI